MTKYLLLFDSYGLLRYKFFTAVTMKKAVFWDVAHLLTLVFRLRIFFFFLLPWRWRQYVPTKARLTHYLHGVTSRKTAFLSYGLVFMGRPLWREDGSAFCICCWFSPAQCFSGPSPLGLATTFYCLRFETSLFVASYARRVTVEVFYPVTLNRYLLYRRRMDNTEKKVMWYLVLLQCGVIAPARNSVYWAVA
jgi:hypothetical protein